MPHHAFCTVSNYFGLPHHAFCTVRNQSNSNPLVNTCRAGLVLLFAAVPLDVLDAGTCVWPYTGVVAAAASVLACGCWCCTSGEGTAPSSRVCPTTSRGRPPSLCPCDTGALLLLPPSLCPCDTAVDGGGALLLLPPSLCPCDDEGGGCAVPMPMPVGGLDAGRGTRGGWPCGQPPKRRRRKKKQNTQAHIRMSIPNSSCVCVCVCVCVRENVRIRLA